MFRKSVTAMAVIFAGALVVPTTALAGAPPAGNTIVVPPVFDSAGSSGLVVEDDATGFSVGYNLNTAGPAVGSGTLNSNGNFRNAASAATGWPDLDGNGITDIVRVNGAGTLTGTLLADGGAWVSESSAGIIATLPSGFDVLAWTDLNGDGNTDLVVQNDQTGATVGYLMDGLSISSSGQLPGLPPQGGYRTIGFPDLDGANGSDLVIQASSGYTFGYILTDGLTAASQGALPGKPSANWSTIGFPDLDGNGTADIVLQEDGGFTFAALMNGLTETSRAQIPGLPTGDPSNWTTIGFPDLDAQNGGDIMNQHSGGYTFVALMNGTTVVTPATVIRSLPQGDVANWEVVGFPQLDAADGADYVLRHSGGYTFGALFDGTTETGDGQLPSQASGTFDAIGYQRAWGVIPAPVF